MSDMGSKYVLSMTDAFTKYSKIFAIPSKGAKTVADIVFTKWMCPYDCQSIIHTDGGKEFLNKVAAELYKKWTSKPPTQLQHIHSVMHKLNYSIKPWTHKKWCQ
jgi:hypothetical protein